MRQHPLVRPASARLSHTEQAEQKPNHTAQRRAAGTGTALWRAWGRGHRGVAWGWQDGMAGGHGGITHIHRVCHGGMRCIAHVLAYATQSFVSIHYTQHTQDTHTSSQSHTLSPITIISNRSSLIINSVACFSTHSLPHPTSNH